MSRIIDYIGEPVDVGLYEEKHYFENQVLTDGVAVNPVMREHFDSTTNEEREQKEIDDWWERPYIVTTEGVKRSHAQYKADCLESGVEPFKYTEAEWEEEIAKVSAKWFELFPTGIRYDVRCLDGGAWDRSTARGQYGSLEAAIDACKRYELPDYRGK